MYQPGKSLPSPSETYLQQAETKIVTVGDGLELSSWYEAPEAENPVIVYFQGNAGTIADRTFKAAPWAHAGYGVWLTGYRGFGGNPGAPSEFGLYQDARAVIDALSAEGIGPDRIILYGESLGSGVATEMARMLAEEGRPARGLVLEAPYTSMPAAAQDHYPYVPAKWLVKDKYDNLGKIGGVGTPLLIIHGDRDKVVAQRHGRALYESAAEPKLAFWVSGAAHNNLYDFGAGERVQAFIESLKP